MTTRLTWNTEHLGEFHQDVPKAEVVERVQLLLSMGFDVKVEVR